MAEWHGDCSRGSNREGHQHYSDDKSLVRSRQATSSSSSCTGDGRSSPGGEGKWRDVDTASCCLLDDLKKCHKKLGRLNFSSTHTVLVDVSIFNASEQLQPQDGRDMWHKGFVKMPFSPLSVVTTKTGLRKPTQVPRWEIISKKLDGLASKKKRGVDDVVEVIIKCNPQYTDEWTFDALFSLVKCIPKEENYFDTLFPKIAALALSLPQHVKKAIPLLQTGQCTAITLSQVQISCLLANAFFCTFPHRNTTRPNAEYHNYPPINFNSLFGNWSDRKKEKLRAIMHYFNMVTDENTKPKGLVTFERRGLRDSELPSWRSCDEKLSRLHVTSKGNIEANSAGMLQVDFASRWIGGGVLGNGLVQEEILFLMNPELIVSRLFTERLADNECLIVTGSQQFSQYSGFGDNFEWAGPHNDKLKRDEWVRLQRQILAIDALHFKYPRDQYNMIKVTRELNKAYCGFKGHGDGEPDIATGKWGCGVFNGDPQLKAVIQLMAAAKAKKGLAFFTFGDEELANGLKQIYHLLVTEKMTVEKLYGLLEDYCAVQQADSHVDLFKFIRDNIRCSRSQL
ncbi:poly(ADP-ribose) glycohydrolase isoform X2 [Hippoglossus stenolepis]|uniref:poly(ADP-ribose) glycohydrolase isoform X2 n=1 Tax=Hippoglossus stenolepis TaxID=195615 RepID=UPI00159CB0FB|nr:poly(ADP-ribose) glycohydrolase isoform X2 [Hippoglossus stenolepis]